jgi:hypothetical protein
MAVSREGGLLEETVSIEHGAAAQITFLRNLQRLLDEGQFTASYKYALLLALAELSVERSAASDGTLALPLPQLAERFMEFYWRHTAPFRGAGVLAQNTGRQAAVLGEIARLQKAAGSLAEARRSPSWNVRVASVRKLLLAMPLWKLQTVGRDKLAFLYDEVLVDDAILLKAGVAACFRDLQGIVQALVQVAWIRFVQRLPQNRSLIGPGGDLAEFLFGAERAALGPLRARLLDLQGGACFYCGTPVRTEGEVDHFVPWVRYPRDLGHNFVLAHAACNRDKSDLLADVHHLERWHERNTRERAALAVIFDAAHLLHDADTTARVAGWCYDTVERSGGLVWVDRGRTRNLDASWRGVLR